MSSGTWQDYFDVPLVIKFQYYGILPSKRARLPRFQEIICQNGIIPNKIEIPCLADICVNAAVSTKVGQHIINKYAQVSTKVDRYHIAKSGFEPCLSRLSLIILKDYSARAQNMCSAHIFKLLVMYVARNMCSAYIFKVTYSAHMRCPRK